MTFLSFRRTAVLLFAMCCTADITTVRDASAAPTAALPENIVDGSGSTPPVTPLGPSTSCIIYQGRRGPGDHSRWHEPADYPYYSDWEVWIPAPAAPSEMFFWADPPDYFRRESGWVLRPEYLPTGNFGGNYDPCNRCEGSSCSTCSSFFGEMPVTVEYPPGSGRTYRLMDKPFSEGGRCGSSECPCYVSGIVSPLVLDFGGAGLKYTQDGEHVAFDLGDGSAPTSWIRNSSDVAFLVADLNGDGNISSINEMFGNKTKGPDQEFAADGFAALAKHDSNHDQKIDSKDKIFPLLKLWFDANGDGKSSVDELHSLADKKVSALSLASRNIVANQDPYGNLTRGVSDASLEGGGSVPIYDVWLAPVNPLSLRSNPGGKSSVTAIPPKGSPQREQLLADWKSTLADQGFGEGEMPFESGRLQTRIDANGTPAGHVATWPHRFDHCRLIVEYDTHWRKHKAYSSCS